MYNFIQKNHFNKEDIFAKHDLEDQSSNGMSINNIQPTIQSTLAWMDEKHDKFAEKLWEDYQKYLYQYGVDNNI